MKIVSKFKDFYDFNTIYDSDKTIEFRRIPSYISNVGDFNTYIDNLKLKDKKSFNILSRCFKWTYNYYNKIMEGPENEMRFEYSIVGIYPYIYLIPTVTILNKNITVSYKAPYNYKEIEHYNDIDIPFSTEFLFEIGKEHNMDFVQFKGKGKNKKPIHKIILRKYSDIENSYFFLNNYMSSEDIVIDSKEDLKSPEYRDLFHTIGSPIFYMAESLPKHMSGNYNSFGYPYWNFSINPDFSEISKISLEQFSADTSIYSRIEEFLIEQKMIPIPEPSNDIKIESAGFDKKTSFRKDKQSKK